MGFEALMNDSYPIGTNNITSKQIRMIELGNIYPRGIMWNLTGQSIRMVRTENGGFVSSGTYFYQIQAGDYTETRKM